MFTKIIKAVKESSVGKTVSSIYELVLAKLDAAVETVRKMFESVVGKGNKDKEEEVLLLAPVEPVNEIATETL